MRSTVVLVSCFRAEEHLWLTTPLGLILMKQSPAASYLDTACVSPPGRGGKTTPRAATHAAQSRRRGASSLKIDMLCVARGRRRRRLAGRWAPPGSTEGGAALCPHLAGQCCHAPAAVMMPSTGRQRHRAGRLCKVVKESRSAESSACWRGLPS